MKYVPSLVALGVAAAASIGSASSADKQYVIGVSNTLIGNGWREEFVCSIKAEALASGLVSKVVLANRNGGPSEQIADLRALISAGVNAIIINPSDRKALDGVIKQAAEKGIVVVAADQAVSAPEAYVVISDAATYGELGAGWLFKHLNGKGSVVEMRGIDGTSGDADRKDGFERRARPTRTSRSPPRPSPIGRMTRPRSRWPRCLRPTSSSTASGRPAPTIRSSKRSRPPANLTCR